MSLVRRNILANMIGTVIVTALTLAITPVQIHILGMEAYGIVGFITTLQVAFTAFDFGLSSTLTRELAADPSSNKSASDPLIRTALSVYWMMALLIGAALVAMAGPIARFWFNPDLMGSAELEQSLRVIALYLALRWPVALYVGILSGFQRMDALNIIKVVSAAVRLIGGIAVLVLYRSLESFLWWTVASAVLEVGIYSLACRRIHSTMSFRFGFSRAAVRRVWRFSLHMNLLAILAVVIVQLDRLVVSKIMPLEILGQYNLIYAAASLITLIIAAVSSAILPSFAAAHGRGEGGDIVHRYRDADHIMLFLTGLPTFALIAYGQPVLELWVGRSAAAGTALPLSILAVGFWCSAVIANVYNVAVARGSPEQFLKANVIGILPYGMLLYFLTERYGIVGAAASWVTLNLYYGLVLVRPIHRDMVGIPTSRWLGRIIVPYAALGALAFHLPKFTAELLRLEVNLLLYVVMLLISAALYTLLILFLFRHSLDFMRLLRPLRV